MLKTNHILLITRLVETYAKGDPKPTPEDIAKYRTYLGTLEDWQISNLYDEWLQRELKTRSKARNPKPTQQPNLI